MSPYGAFGHDPLRYGNVSILLLPGRSPTAGQTPIVRSRSITARSFSSVSIEALLGDNRGPMKGPLRTLGRFRWTEAQGTLAPHKHSPAGPLSAIGSDWLRPRFLCWRQVLSSHFRLS